ncbi:30S ribosomal protein S6 [Candidatus Roizmanbacteria bacterium]|nr:30S ribosomal protein S6 [Candidatus Roizmanbacteria bacterium]
MAKYELTLLLNEESELENIKKLIESFSGKLLEDEKWGKKTLAYPIKKNTTAEFFFWKFEIDQKNVNELRKKLNFNEKLLRYLLLISEK